jgi:hypothetical protein
MTIVSCVITSKEILNSTRLPGFPLFFTSESVSVAQRMARFVLDGITWTILRLSIS